MEFIMFHFLYRVFIMNVLVLSSSLAQGETGIKQIDHISDVKNSIDSQSLVLFNITGTLYESSTTMSDQKWREYFAGRVTKLIPDQELANKIINATKNDIVQSVPKKLVEPQTKDLIQELQAKKIPVFAITEKKMATDYAENFGQITSDHLKRLGINLEKSATYSKIPVQSGSDKYSFAYGIIFSNKKPVGPAVMEFLQDSGLKPSRIIMIDDSQQSLENVQKDLDKSIEFYGFRYGHTDAKKAQFDPTLGIIEFLAFSKNRKIMSDEDAMKIRKANPAVNYENQLDELIKSKM